MAESESSDPPPHSADDSASFDQEPPPVGRFGTFGGVFTPSILTILGVVMYLRFGWVVGQQGLLGALAIVVIAHLISLATGLSVASISTNRAVGAGGAYYMISRSLGAPAGAAIGVPLFLGQALGTTFYIVGFTEALAGFGPMGFLRQPLVAGLTGSKLLGSAILVGLIYLSVRSAAVAIRIQYLVMAGIVLSLISFFLGGQGATHEPTWIATGDQPFWAVFAVFFPAVTGIMAGVSMSGDLKDPRQAIPKGTLLAVGVGLVVYLAFPFWLAWHATPEQLISDYRVVWSIAAVPLLIDVGVWAATLSSALSSVLTAPRTLQALARDGHVPKLFGKGYGKNNEPMAGLLLTGLLAEVGIVIGDLNMIAPVLTMFFLVTYGMTNLACGLERWAASPSFRPDFKVPASVSLIGAGSCFYVMSIIDMGAMFVALSVCAAIFVLTQRRVLGTTFGDARHGIWSALARSALHRMQRTDFHPQNWRPNLLILGGDPDKRIHLLRLGSAMVQERGIVTYVHLIRGDVLGGALQRKALQKTLGSQVEQEFPNVFYRVDIVSDVYRGIVTLAQGYGVGSLEANTVLLGFTHKRERRKAFMRTIADLTALDKSVLLVHPGQQQRRRNRVPQLHVWWGGMDNNGGLMLLLAYLLTAGRMLQGAKVTVVTVVDTEAEVAPAKAILTKTLRSARLHAEAEVIAKKGRLIPALMAQRSGKADLAILGFRTTTAHRTSAHDAAETDDAHDLGVHAFFDRMQAMLDVLPTTLMVHSARNFESDPVLFDR